MYSMTGFGRAAVENEKYRISLEIKSLNHRYCDINIRMPYQLNAFEDVVRQAIKNRCQRGRFEVYLQFDNLADGNYTIMPNFSVIDQYVNAHDAICQRYQLTDKPRAMNLLNLKDALTIETAELDESLLRKTLDEALATALDGLVAMRLVEGDKLLKDVTNQLKIMEEVVAQLNERAPLISENYHAGLKQRLADMLASSNIDEARILTEAAIFADKTNISEELVRLKAHFEQLKTMISDKKAKGRRMDFLIQEINREVNTIGSKSPDIDISEYVVLLKSQVEKIREQVQNIE